MSRARAALFPEIFPARSFVHDDADLVRKPASWDVMVPADAEAEIADLLNRSVPALERCPWALQRYYEAAEAAGRPLPVERASLTSRHLKIVYRAAKASLLAGTDGAEELLDEHLADAFDFAAFDVAELDRLVDDPVFQREMAGWLAPGRPGSMPRPAELDWDGVVAGAVDRARSGCLEGLEPGVARLAHEHAAQLNLSDVTPPHRPVLGTTPPRRPLPLPLDRTAVERVHGFIGSGTNRERLPSDGREVMQRVAALATEPLGVASPTSRDALLVTFAAVSSVDVYRGEGTGLARTIVSRANPLRRMDNSLRRGVRGRDGRDDVLHAAGAAAAAAHAIADRMSDHAESFAVDLMDRVWVSLHNAELVDGQSSVAGFDDLVTLVGNHAYRVVKTYTKQASAAVSERNTPSPDARLAVVREVLADLDSALIVAAVVDRHHPQRRSAIALWSAAMRRYCQAYPGVRPIRFVELEALCDPGND